MQDAVRIVHAGLAALDTPFSLKVSLLLQYEEWDQIAKLGVDPNSYTSPDAYYLDAQAHAFVKKAEFLPPLAGIERKAIETWWQCERQNFRTNRFFDSYLINRGVLPSELLIFDRVRLKMNRLLGRCPDEKFLVPRFGPGATMSDRSHESTVPDKLSSRVTLTIRALPFLNAFGQTAWARALNNDVGRVDKDLHIVDGNKFFTVPKDFSKRRSCAKEPSLNGAFQLAIGKVLRRRLLKARINLDEGQELHQALARKASINGDFSTIDLSNASDCLAREVVRFLLPPAWFSLLDAARSPKTKVDGKWVLLEKFSSMGNGYTFELETMVFLAICLAVHPDLVSGENVFVYGDDIIIPSSHTQAVLDLLRLFGFSPNVDKTFTSGPFRESCGGDYFQGKDVRPYFFKVSPDEPARLIPLINGLRRSASKIPNPVIRDRLSKLRGELLSSLPAHIRKCRGPIELGDIVIHDSEDRWCTKRKDSIRYVRVYRPSKFRKKFIWRYSSEVIWAALLYGIYLSGDSSKDITRYIVPRDGVAGYACSWVPFS